VYNILSYTYVQLLLMMPYIIVQFAVMDHLKSNFVSDANGSCPCTMCCEFHVRDNWITLLA